MPDIEIEPASCQVFVPDGLVVPVPEGLTANDIKYWVFQFQVIVEGSLIVKITADALPVGAAVGLGVDVGAGVGVGVAAGISAKFAVIVPGPFIVAVVELACEFPTEFAASVVHKENL